MIPEVAIEPVAIRHADPTLIYDIATLLNAVYQHTIEPTQQGRIPKRLAKKLCPLLSKNQAVASDYGEDYLNMLFEILHEMHLIRLVSPPMKTLKPYCAPGRALSGWNQQSVQQQTVSLLQHWQGSYRWIDHSVGPSNWDLDMGQQNARITLLNYLCQCQDTHWYSVQDLLHLIWQEHPLGLQPIIPQYMYKIIERKVQGSYDSWLQQNEYLYTGILTSTLHDLGIVDIGFRTSREAISDYRDIFIRITKAGQQTLHASEPAEQNQPAAATPAESTLIVQPNYEIIQLDFDLPALYAILPFTQIISINRASRLQLTLNSIHRGMRAGYDIERIIRILQTGSQQELPQNVIYTLQEWGKLYKQAVITPVILLQLPSAEIAERLSQHPFLRKMEPRLIAPNLLIVRSEANLQSLGGLLDREGIEAHFQP